MGVFVFGSILVAGMLLRLMWHREPLPRFRKKSLFTGSDLEFFCRLRAALPECTVCAQVAARALIEPAGMGKLRRHGIGRLEGRRVGNVVFDENMRPLAVVELSYRGRLTRDQAAMDACFASAGIKVIRFSAHKLPSELKIRSTVFAHTSMKNGPAVNLRSDRGIDFHRPASPWRDTAGIHS